jgi:hypothetical protein
VTPDGVDDGVPDRQPTAYVPARDPLAENPILTWLDRWGWGAIPKGAIPPVDPAIGQARDEAGRTAASTGRTDRVSELRRLVRETVLHQYDAVAFQSAWFVGSNDPIDRRIEVVEMLTDAALAYELFDVLPDWATLGLLARFDVYQGGPVFREESAPPP